MIEQALTNLQQGIEAMSLLPLLQLLGARLDLLGVCRGRRAQDMEQDALCERVGLSRDLNRAELDIHGGSAVRRCCTQSGRGGAVMGRWADGAPNVKVTTRPLDDEDGVDTESNRACSPRPGIQHPTRFRSGLLSSLYFQDAKKENEEASRATRTSDGSGCGGCAPALQAVEPRPRLAHVHVHVSSRHIDTSVDFTPPESTLDAPCSMLPNARRRLRRRPAAHRSPSRPTRRSPARTP